MNIYNICILPLYRETRLHGYSVTHRKQDTKINKMRKHAEESEKAIEAYLARKVKEMGGVALKYASATMVGYPDRVCLLPNGKTLWVELKSKGERPRAIQRIRHQQMEAMGHRVYVCDSKAGVDKVLNQSNEI